MVLVHVVPFARRQAGGEIDRPWKEPLAREGKAHAALVFDGDAGVGWCQFGSPDELPKSTTGRTTGQLTEELPDYRLTCIFVDRNYRRKGVAGVALRGAFNLIAEAGSGVVEGYPQDLPEGKKISSNFLYKSRAAFMRRPASATTGRRVRTTA